MTTSEPFPLRHNARADDRQAAILAERNECRVLLLQVEAERDNLRTQLGKALEEVEHWRTLAEHRAKRLSDIETRQTGEAERR